MALTEWTQHKTNGRKSDGRRAHRSYLSYIDKSREYYGAHGYPQPYQWAYNHEVAFTPPVEAAVGKHGRLGHDVVLPRRQRAGWRACCASQAALRRPLR